MLKEFNIFAQALKVGFKCPYCGSQVSAKIQDIPSPNWSGDTVDSSMNSHDEDFVCPHCRRLFSAEMYTNIYYGDIQIIDSSTGKELKDFDMQQIDSNESHDVTLTEQANIGWLKKTIRTQYGDIDGLSFIDGQSGPGDLMGLIRELGVDTSKYIVHAFEMYGVPTDNHEISCSIYLLERSSISDVNDENINRHVISKTYSIPYEMFNSYIKRFSVGYLVPHYLSD